MEVNLLQGREFTDLRTAVKICGVKGWWLDKLVKVQLISNNNGSKWLIMVFNDRWLMINDSYGFRVVIVVNRG